MKRIALAALTALLLLPAAASANRHKTVTGSGVVTFKTRKAVNVTLYAEGQQLGYKASYCSAFASGPDSMAYLDNCRRGQLRIHYVTIVPLSIVVFPAREGVR